MKKTSKMERFLGKTTLGVTFILLSIYCQAQITLDGKSITLKADTMTVKQAFRLLNYMVPANQRVNKIVIKDSKEWYQTRYLINRMMKRRAYTEVNGKVKLVRI